MLKIASLDGIFSEDATELLMDKRSKNFTGSCV